MARYRLTIDTGGTFSDLVLLDEDSGAMRVVKIPSTPDDPAHAVLNGLDQLAADGKGRAGDDRGASAASTTRGLRHGGRGTPRRRRSGYRAGHVWDVYAHATRALRASRYAERGDDRAGPAEASADAH